VQEFYLLLVIIQITKLAKCFISIKNIVFVSGVIDSKLNPRNNPIKKEVSHLYNLIIIICFTYISSAAH